MQSPNETLARANMNFTRNQVRIPVSVNGSDPFELILDTGMPNRGVILCQSARVEALGLCFPDSETLVGGGSGPGVEARVAPSERIALGDLVISGVPVIVVPAQVAAMLGTDGIVGAELFERYAVRVDVDARQIVLIESARFEPAEGSSEIPIRIREGIPFLDARVTVDSGAAVAADLGVDLGGGHALWLNEGDDGRLAPPPATISTVLGMGVSGEIRGSFGRVRRLEIGPFAFDHVVTLFPVAEHRHAGGVDFRDGFVGTELLSRFAVTFDYAEKRMVLEPGARMSKPFEYDMTGLVTDLSNVERWRINGVVSGSPAEEAGMQAGDIVLRVDGKAVAELADDDISRAFAQEGAVIRFTIERDSVGVEKTLTLRRLL